MKIGAFFDMDYTVLDGSAGVLYVRYLWTIRYVPWYRWPPILRDVGLYAIGLRDFPQLMARLMKQAAGTGEAEAWRLSAEWFEAVLRHHIADGARRQVAWHLAQGHHVALVSASTPFAVRPVAHALGIGDAYLATYLETRNGEFTGRVAGQACFGPGKVTLTRQYARERGIDITASYFYSDSHHDLPLLEAVGHPVAVNPDRKLAAIATARNWPVMKFY